MELCRTLMKFTTLSLALSAIAAPAAQLDCPTAKRGDANYFFWTTTSYIDRAVWSGANDGTLVGVEFIFEQKKNWDPITPGIKTRKQCHQFFKANADGSNRVNIGTVGEKPIYELYGYPNQGYILSNVYVGPNWEYQLISSTTGEKIATLPSFVTYGGLYPSPSGDLIAFVNTVFDDITSVSSANSTVQFYNPQGQKVGSEVTLENTSVPIATWNIQNQFLLAAGDHSVAVSPSGFTPAPVPKCFNPKTTSTDTNLKGEIIGNEGGKLAIIGHATPDNTFGCQ